MNPFSRELITRLRTEEVLLAARPRLLLGADEAPALRVRARTTAGAVDALAEKARAAADDELLFGPNPEIPYLCQRALKSLSAAAFVLEDEGFAGRALEGVERIFSFPPEEWIARPHRPMRCDHAMLNVAANIGIALDLCADFWSEEAVGSVSERLYTYTLPRFLETWQKRDAQWASPGYHWNWKIMCCGEAGVAALSCGEAIPNLNEVLDASLAGVLDILDCVPPEGDWPEGAGYWLGTLGYGLRFGLALRRATDGSVDVFGHPAVQGTGDYIVHVTEPDGGVYDFNDNPLYLGESLDYLLLLAEVGRRGDWARTARMSDHVTLERLAWDDPSLESAPPAPDDTARHFPWTGLVTMRSGWEEEATYVGFKSGSSDVGHSHLDANSFVVSARGERLLVDEGKWPYAHFLGFFKEETRFNFDANGTVGHNTLLVDGEGQCFGPEYPGRIVSFHSDPEMDLAVGDAAAAYGGKLRRFLRTLAFVKPDLLLVFDQVAADQPRFLEWLFHHDATVSGDECLTTISRGAATLSLRRILPEDAECWHISDVERTSAYTNSNTGAPESVRIRYRSFGPFHPCTELDVLWAIHVGDPATLPNVESCMEPSRLVVQVIFPEGTRKEVVFDGVS